jgi:hypothetical protein
MARNWEPIVKDPRDIDFVEECLISEEGLLPDTIIFLEALRRFDKKINTWFDNPTFFRANNASEAKITQLRYYFNGCGLSRKTTEKGLVLIFSSSLGALEIGEPSDFKPTYGQLAFCSAQALLTGIPEDPEYYAIKWFLEFSACSGYTPAAQLLQLLEAANAGDVSSKVSIVRHVSPFWENLPLAGFDTTFHTEDLGFVYGYLCELTEKQKPNGSFPDLKLIRSRLIRELGHSDEEELILRLIVEAAVTGCFEAWKEIRSLSSDYEESDLLEMLIKAGIKSG